MGGYWTSDGLYIGGDIRRCKVEFESPSVSMLVGMVQNEGFADNMSKFSYFPSREDNSRKELCGDADVAEMINCTHGLKSMNLYVVRDDDPYLEDVLVGEEEEEEEPEYEPTDFYRDDYAETDDSDDDGYQSSFFVGQAFFSKESCKKAIEKYAIKEKVNIRFQKSESKKVAAACIQDCCSWRIYASVNSRSTNMVVRSYICTHTCYPTGVVKLYSAPKIASDFLNEFRTNKKLSADQMMQRLLIQGLRVPKSKCQSARQIMLHIISDEYAEQFTRMFDYAEELRESNPGSTVILGTKDKVFEKFYTCFEAQKSGWKNACRRVIHLDGTFLKGRMKGQLLTAVGRDPNDQIFVIAWAIVPVENKVNWEWFMTLLQEDLDLEFGNGLALSSDQQKGLIYAIKNVLPYAEHRMCARHIWSNLRKRHGESGNLHGLFWKCARAYNTQVFDRRLEKMKSVRPEAYEEVKRSVGSNWSRYHKCVSLLL